MSRNQNGKMQAFLLKLGCLAMALVVAIASGSCRKQEPSSEFPLETGENSDQQKNSEPLQAISLMQSLEETEALGALVGVRPKDSFYDVTLKGADHYARLRYSIDNEDYRTVLTLDCSYQESSPADVSEKSAFLQELLSYSMVNEPALHEIVDQAAPVLGKKDGQVPKKEYKEQRVAYIVQKGVFTCDIEIDMTAGQFLVGMDALAALLHMQVILPNYAQTYNYRAEDAQITYTVQLLSPDRLGVSCYLSDTKRVDKMQKIFLDIEPELPVLVRRNKSQMHDAIGRLPRKQGTSVEIADGLYLSYKTLMKSGFYVLSWTETVHSISELP